MAVHRARLARYRDSDDSCRVQVMADNQVLHATAYCICHRSALALLFHA